MAREICFRGKSKSTGEWVEGYYVGDNTIIPFNEVVYDMGFIDTSPCHECYPDTIGQFTGLYDKNGKEIYEWDILKIGIVPRNYSGSNPTPYSTMCVCVYVANEGRFAYQRISPNSKRLSRNWRYKSLGSDELYSVEVTDNIHDNPELLEK